MSLDPGSLNTPVGSLTLSEVSYFYPVFCSWYLKSAMSLSHSSKKKKVTLCSRFSPKRPLAFTPIAHGLVLHPSHISDNIY